MSTELTEQDRKQMFGEENRYTASKLYNAASKFFTKYDEEPLKNVQTDPTVENSER